MRQPPEGSSTKFLKNSLMRDKLLKDDLREVSYRRSTETKLGKPQGAYTPSYNFFKMWRWYIR